MKLIRKIPLIILGCFALTIIMKPLLPFFKSRITNNSPQLILVLGGEIDREIIGIRFAKELKIPLLISGGSNPEYSDWLIKKEGISAELVKRDYRAKDTLTNFTSIVDDLADENINHILLITSEYHINRAKIVGEIITGSRGIRLTSLSIPCTAFCQQESKRKKNIDVIRAITWVATGQDFKELMPEIMKYQLGE